MSRPCLVVGPRTSHSPSQGLGFLICQTGVMTPDLESGSVEDVGQGHEWFGQVREATSRRSSEPQKVTRGQVSRPRVQTARVRAAEAEEGRARL